MVRAIGVVAAVMLLASPAVASDPEHDDKLCEVIGEAPNISVPPRDRLWFKENCTCAGSAGCGVAGSKRFIERLDVAKRALAKRAAAERGRAEAERKAQAARAATAAEAAKRKEEESKLAEAAYMAREAQRDRETTALHDSLLASFRTEPVGRMVRCSSEFKKWAPRLFVGDWLGAESYCESIETEFRATPEFSLLRDRVVEACKPYRACMDDRANRDCAADRGAYESACEVMPDYRLCMDRTTNCSAEPQ